MEACWARILDVLPESPEEQMEIGFRIVRHAHQLRLRQSEVNASKILERQKAEQDRRVSKMMEERQVVVNERTKLLEENRRCVWAARAGVSVCLTTHGVVVSARDEGPPLTAAASPVQRV